MTEKSHTAPACTLVSNLSLHEVILFEFTIKC
jgi:hypothetical protein